MLVPGTRTDPEFTAVRLQPWDQSFSCGVWFPTSAAVANKFLTEAWRLAGEAELQSLNVRFLDAGGDRAGWFATTDPGSPPDTMVVVLPSFAELLVSAWRSSGGAEFESWVKQEVLPGSREEVDPHPEEATWRYDLVLDQLSSDQSSASGPLKRELFVWPGDPEKLTATELLAVPHLPALPAEPDFAALSREVVELGRELWRQVSTTEAVYRLTMQHRGLDAVAALARATNPEYAGLISRETGVELRKLSRRIRDRVGASGWRLSGYADALSWPIQIASADEIPADLVSELAIDLLRRAETVALPPAPDLAAWERRLVEVETLRVQRKGR